MAGESNLKELMEEVIQELEDDEALNPERDLSWDQFDDHEPDFESGYHE